MEYKYYRELKHNYLIFEEPDNNENPDRYQYKIAESGRIKNLVPCTERNINGEKYFYYEIGSMQTLRDRFAVSRMDHRQLRGLFLSIKELLEDLSEFLMGDEGLVFNGRDIYTDLSTGEYRFIFCPFYDEQKSFSEFSMELLEMVDETDAQATEMVYKLCELSSGQGDFIYQVIENVLEGQESCEKEVLKSGIIMSGVDQSFERKDQETFEGDFQEEDSEYEEFEEKPLKNSRFKRADKRLGGKFQILFAMMFSAILGAMVYIRMNYTLTSQENMLSILVMMVSAVTGGISLAGGFKEMKGAKLMAKADEETDPSEDCEDEEFEYNDLAGDFDFTEKGQTFREQIRVSGPLHTQKTEFECGETVVLDDNSSDEIALFSRNLDKTVRIALSALPVTVGKMEGCVDRVLSDKSISRIHCRFMEEAGKVAVLDLGSTNGTYRNGIRLKPQEKTFIEQGDEIRIGRVCFDCR